MFEAWVNVTKGILNVIDNLQGQEKTKEAMFKSLENEHPVEMKNLDQLEHHPELVTAIRDYQEYLKEYEQVFKERKTTLEKLKDQPLPIIHFTTILFKTELAEMKFQNKLIESNLYASFNKANEDIQEKINKEMIRANRRGTPPDPLTIKILEQKLIRPSHFGLPDKSSAEVMMSIIEELKSYQEIWSCYLKQSVHRNHITGRS